jgi:CubicO group peptidase (beta-lactamase class C family)
MNRRFFRPLGLVHTYLSLGEQPPASYAVAHPWVDIDQDGRLEDLYGVPQTWKVTLTHPVIYATPGDLAHWMDALYDEKTVLESQSLVEMLTYPQVDQRDPEGGIYGLGMVDFTERLGTQAIGHAGSALGYSAAALYLPEYEVSMAWMINTGESPPELAGRMMQAAWDALVQVVRENEEPKE